MMKLKQTGFTLIELIMVIVIVGVIASTMVVFFKPAFDSYLAVGRRAELTDQTDTTLRKMTRDIRLAVPNSIRLVTPQCFELIPTSTGGRYRTAPDTVWDVANATDPSRAMDMSTATDVFDVMTAWTTTPALGDWVVIDNQNTNDVYAGINRAAIASIDTPTLPSPPAGSPRLGVHRIRLTAATQFPTGYDGGRFNVIPDAQQAVFYVCASPVAFNAAGQTTLDANGDGRGTLYRFAHYGFNAASPATCPVPVITSPVTPVLVSNVESCLFIYSPNQGATQENGFVEIQLRVTQRNESVSLVFGAHVDNVP